MTKRIGSAVTTKVLARMNSGTAGVNAGLAALTHGDSGLAAALGGTQIRAQNVAADLAEKSVGTQYPAVNVYCERIVNNLIEKFRRFSGTVEMAIEIRHSQDRLEGLQDRLELYADAVSQSLDAARGDWGDGMYYAGGYEVAFGPVKHGGRNFLQQAKVTFKIGASRS
jgi:hypothetical protein